MKESEIKLSVGAYNLIVAMDGMPDCFLRPHRLPGGARGFRLLNARFVPFGSYTYAVVERGVLAGYIVPVRDGDKFYIYRRTGKKLPGTGGVVI